MNFPTPTTSLTATVTNSLGVTLGSHSIPITAPPLTAEPALAFRPFPILGMAPMSTRFTLTSRKGIARIELDLNGDGVTDFQGATLDEQEFSLREPGLYYPTVTVTDTDGKIHTDSALLQVFDPKQLDRFFQAKWKAMKDALRQGKTREAANYIVINKRDGYEEIFKSLTIPFADIDQTLTEISLVKFAGITVEYEMTYMEGGEQFSGMVLFTLDRDGFWRISFF